MAVYKFQLSKVYYSSRLLRVLTQEQLEEIREAGKRIPSLLKLIEPCYDEQYFQDGSTKLAILIRGTESRSAWEFLSEYFGFRRSITTSKNLLREEAESKDRQRMIFPQFFDAEPESVLPVEYVPANTLMSGDICSMKTEDPLTHALLVSQMFSSWLRMQGRGKNGLCNMWNNLEGFPAPEEQKSEELATWVMVLRKYHDAVMAQVINEGGSYQEHIPAGMRSVLDEIDRLVDAMYPGYEKGMDRGAYLQEIHTKRSRQEAWAHDLPFHPALGSSAVPVLLVLLGSETPLEPIEVAAKAGIRGERCASILLQLVNAGQARAVNTPRTYKDKNGRYSRRAYEATVDRMKFFRQWIDCWLPDESEERRRVWKAAQQEAERTMYFPTKKELQILQKLWRRGSPIPYRELVNMPYDYQMREKEWVVKNEKEEYITAITEIEMRTEAVRTILSLQPGEVELLAGEKEGG